MNKHMNMGGDEKKIIFFDFDGVIIDSVGLSHDTYNSIWENISREEYVSRFDGNINETVAEDRVLEGKDPKSYFDLYYPHILQQDIFPKVPEAIKEIHQKYELLFIVSSSRSDAIEAYLAHHDMRSYFAEALGADVHPKKTVKMAGILEKYGGRPENAVMITDTLGDIREAASIGVGSIAVSWGFQDAANLLKGNPHRLIELPEHLPDAIRDYFERRKE